MCFGWFQTGPKCWKSTAHEDNESGMGMGELTILTIAYVGERPRTKTSHDLLWNWFEHF